METTDPIIIVRPDRMTPGMARYWNCMLREELARKVPRFTLIDPWRLTLKQLAAMGYSGRTVYRASTGGTYGKSAQIREIP